MLNKYSEIITGIMVGLSVIFVMLPIASFLLFDSNISKSDLIQVVISFVFLVTVIQANISFNSDRNQKSSENHLSSALEFTNRALDSLTEEGRLTNNNRKWASAARLVVNAERLANMIKQEPYQQIWLSELLFLKNRFWDIYQLSGNDVPESFFLGVKNPCPEMTLGQAAYENTKNYDFLRNGWISEESIAALFRFFSYSPDPYDDPLYNIENLSEKECFMLKVRGSEGIVKYLDFLSKYDAVSQDVHRKSDGRRVTTKEIDGNSASLIN